MSHFNVSVIVPARVYEGHDFTKEGLKVAEELTSAFVNELMEPYEENPAPGSPYLEETDNSEYALNDYFNLTVTRYKLPNGHLVNEEAAVIKRDATAEEHDILVNNYSAIPENNPKFSNVVRVASKDDGNYRIWQMVNGAEQVRVPMFRSLSYRNFVQHEYMVDNMTLVDEDNEISDYDSCYFMILKPEAPIDKVWSSEKEYDEKKIRELLEGSIYVGIYCSQNPRWDYWSIISNKDENTGEVTGIIPTKDGRQVPACTIEEMALEYDWDENMEEYCRAYWEIATEQRKMTKAEKESHQFFTFYKKEYYLEMYGTYENYRQSVKSFHTHAIVTEDDGWIEPGTVGWFATCDDAPESRKKYYNQFEEIIKNANPNDVIVGVDCHI